MNLHQIGTARIDPAEVVAITSVTSGAGPQRGACIFLRGIPTPFISAASVEETYRALKAAAESVSA